MYLFRFLNAPLGGGGAAATQTFAPGGKHPRAATAGGRQQTSTTTRSCLTRKRALHVHSPGVAVAHHERALHCGPLLLL